MNFNLLNKLVEESNLGKVRISEMAKISRTTLDNVLNGADAKVSTIESLAKVLRVNASIFFSDDSVDRVKINSYEEEIKRLQTLLNNRVNSTKVIVELDVSQDEFIKMGLKDKVIQILNK